jgi:uncharacterized protein (TIGR02246 family)
MGTRRVAVQYLPPSDPEVMTVDGGADEAEIRRVEASYDNAWQRADVAGLIACLTEDAVVVNPRDEVSRGRDEIGSMLSQFLATEARGSNHVSEIVRVEFVTDDVAVADGEARIEAAAGTIRHSFTDVLIRTASEWKIAHTRAYVRGLVTWEST